MAWYITRKHNFIFSMVVVSAGLLLPVLLAQAGTTGLPHHPPQPPQPPPQHPPHASQPHTLLPPPNSEHWTDPDPWRNEIGGPSSLSSSQYNVRNLSESSDQFSDPFSGRFPRAVMFQRSPVYEKIFRENLNNNYIINIPLKREFTKCKSDIFFFFCLWKRIFRLKGRRQKRPNSCEHVRN